MWVHEEPAQLSGFAWSPDGERLAYFAVEAGAHRLRIFDARAGSAETVALGTDKEIASSSPLVWAPDAFRSGPRAAAGRVGRGGSRGLRGALTEAPVIVQDSRNDFLAWDRVRNIAVRQITALVSLEDGGGSGGYGSVREDPEPTRDAFGAGVLGRRLVRHVFDGDAHEDDVHAAGRDRVCAVPAGPRGRRRARVAAGHRRGADELWRGTTRATRSRTVRTDRCSCVGWTRTRRWDVTEGHRGDAVGAEGGAAEGGAGGRRGRGGRTLRGRLNPHPLHRPALEPSDGDALLLASQDAWHLLDLGSGDAGGGNPASGDLRTLLELEDDEDARPRRQVQGWSEDGRHVHFSFSARDRWQRGLKRLDVTTGAVESPHPRQQPLPLLEHLRRRQHDRLHHVGRRPSRRDPRRRAATSRRPANSPPPTPSSTTSRSPAASSSSTWTSTATPSTASSTTPPTTSPGASTRSWPRSTSSSSDNGFNENMNLITAQGWFGFRPSVRFEEGFPGEAWAEGGAQRDQQDHRARGSSTRTGWASTGRATAATRPTC